MSTSAKHIPDPRSSGVGHGQLPPDLLRWRRWVSVGLIIAATVLSIFASYTAYQVLSNFREIRSKASDNVEWSLAQVELEARDFTNALENASYNTEANLDRLRLRYDILYSRVTTMVTSPVYQRLTTVPEFDKALERVHSFVIDVVDTIDSPDETLRAALPSLIEQSSHLRNDTRTLSLKGLIFFAELSDRQRAGVRDTLLRLTALIVLLLVALVSLAGHLFNLYRLTRLHGQALAEANTRMSTILTTSLDGVVVTDQDGKVLEFNTACEDMFQYAFEDVRGRNIIDLIAPSETREMHRAALRRMVSGEGGHIAGRGRVRIDMQRADGTVFPGEVSVELAEENGQSIFLGFLHEISDRVAAEQELVEARDRALAGEKAKAEFLAVMSHEIRTPLNGLLGNLSLLNDTALSTSQTRYIRNMEISGRVLMRHVDTVLNIARYEAGMMNISLACTDLSVLLQELVDSQLSAAAVRGNTLSWRWEAAPRAWVRTDRAALEQVLLNLIGNAIKFTESGAITVEAEALPETIDGVPAVELRVSDTGIGISEDRIEKVFDDFVTNDAGLGQVPGGTGLGLGIARRIVTEMGGTIGVESTEGEGSVFWVRLPMAAGRKPPTRASAAKAPTALKRYVLVVEDNAINRELTEEILQHEGHSVVTATNGAEGVHLAQDEKYDVILMDIAMPVMDGLEATQKIRQSTGANQNTPIIAVSANILPAERERLLSAGMNGFLSKPLNREDLQKALQNLDTTPNDSGEEARSEMRSLQLLDVHAMQNSSAGLPRDTFARLLQRFIQEGDALTHAITAPYRDTQEVAKLCHNLAGASAIFGARALHHGLVTADTAAKEKDTAALEQALIALPRLWRETRAALSDHMPSDAAE